MNTFLAAILVFSVLQFVVILPVAAYNGNYPLIRTTACPRAAYTFGYHGFTYVPDEFTPVVPQRSYVAYMKKYPYVYRLREKFTVGQAVTIRGTVPRSKAQSVSINLLSKAPTSNLEVGATALHLSFKIDHKESIFTSIEGGTWIPGFRKDLNLRYDEVFEVVIRALTDKFEIIMNGYHYADFPYQVPLDIVDTVSVQYDASVTELRIGGRSFNNVKKVDFPGGHLKLNERVIIEGVSNANDFAINLLDANGRRVLHIRPYFSAGVVFRDTEPFGNDDHSNGNPFTQGKHFALELINRAKYIEINLNRAPFTTYKHRISNPETSYKAIEFDSNVVIEGLEVCTNSRS